MGTQQILLIVLSVIIVGVAVAVGITMFNAQSISSNRSACIGDMNTFAASAYAWYKTPVSHGGGGNDTDNLDIDDIGAWIGFEYDSAKDSLNTENGGYIIELEALTDLLITANGTGTGVAPELRLTWTDGTIVTDATPSP